MPANAPRQIASPTSPHLARSRLIGSPSPGTSVGCRVGSLGVDHGGSKPPPRGAIHHASMIDGGPRRPDSRQPDLVTAVVVAWHTHRSTALRLARYSAVSVVATTNQSGHLGTHGGSGGD